MKIEQRILQPAIDATKQEVEREQDNIDYLTQKLNEARVRLGDAKTALETLLSLVEDENDERREAKYQGRQPWRYLFFPSRTGNAGREDGTNGHEIIVYDNSEVSCNCPGFRHRGYCWASTDVRPYASNHYSLTYVHGGKLRVNTDPDFGLDPVDAGS